MYENRGTKNISSLRLSLELVEVGDCDFATRCRDSHLFFKQPIVDVEFDMPLIQSVKLCVDCYVRRCTKCRRYLRKIILFPNCLLATEEIFNTLLFQASGWTRVLFTRLRACERKI